MLVWSEPALGELDTIADYISLDNPIAASKLVRRVFDSVEQLHTYSKILYSTVTLFAKFRGISTLHFRATAI